jgi:opacity protein-like surface antigen
MHIMHRLNKIKVIRERQPGAYRRDARFMALRFNATRSQKVQGGIMRFVLCILGLVLLSTAALGEEITRKAGDSALNFSFNGLNISDYKYGIGGKRWLTPDLAATASLDIYQSKEVDKTTSPSWETDTNSNLTWYGLSIGMEKHLTSHHNLSPYWGGELTCSKQRYITGASFAGYSYSSTIKQYGINALFGVEYALMENVSLAAEYSYGYSYYQRTMNDGYASTDDRFKRFGGGAGKMMLQFYL